MVARWGGGLGGLWRQGQVEVETVEVWWGGWGRPKQQKLTPNEQQHDHVNKAMKMEIWGEMRDKREPTTFEQGGATTNYLHKSNIFFLIHSWMSFAGATETLVKLLKDICGFNHGFHQTLECYLQVLVTFLSILWITFECLLKLVISELFAYFVNNFTKMFTFKGKK